MPSENTKGLQGVEPWWPCAFEKIEQRLFAVDASLHEVNHHRERLISRIDGLSRRRYKRMPSLVIDYPALGI